MGGKHAFLSFGAFALALLLLLPCAALAEPFTLPAKAVYLESWEYWAVCVEPQVCRYHNYENAYTPDAFIVYRVLISPDGTETVLDYGMQNDNVRNYYPVYYHSLSASVTEKEIDLSEPGLYRVELRLIRMPKATALHASSFAPDSTVDWWIAERVKPGPGTTCTVPWNDNDCWTERKTESGVKLSDRSVLLEYYEITVAAPVTLPDNPENSIDRSSMSMVSVSSPFEQNKGVAQPDNSKATEDLALAGLVGIAAIGAGAYLYRSYSTSTGSSFKAYQTAAGRANESAVLAEKDKIKRMDEEYAEKMRQYELKKKREKTAAMLARLVAAGKTKAKDEKNVTALSFTAGPTAAMIASTGFVPKEDLVGRGAFNFFDALKLKDRYGYTMAEALAVAYEKNKVVNAVNGLASEIEETQTARIEEADKYPWPISSAVKFAASFTKETGAATTALFGNGFFAAGAAATLLFDSATNRKDAGENFTAMGEVLMGALFRGAQRMGSGIKNENVEVSAGMLMSIAIAPEEAVLERSGKLIRVSRAARQGEKTTAKLARRETSAGMEVGAEISERAAIKSMETGEIASLADLMDESAGNVGKEWQKTFIDVSDVNSENK